jgi:hypothetical protein
LGSIGNNVYLNQSDNVWKYTNTHGNIGGTAIQFGACLGGAAANQMIFLRTTTPGIAGATGTLSESMRISESGFVGIGTTTPGVPLDVVGSSIQDVVGNGGGYGVYFSYWSGTAWLGGPSSQQSVSIRANNWIQSNLGFLASSDRRLKENIEKINDESALKFIKESKPVHFSWKTSGEKSYGFIAQDLLKMGLSDMVKVVPAYGSEKALLSENNDPEVKVSEGYKLTVNYNELTAVITSAVKYIYAELSKLMVRTTIQEENLAGHTTQLQKLESENAAKDKKIHTLEEQNTRIKAYLCAKDPRAPFCM